MYNYPTAGWTPGGGARVSERNAMTRTTPTRILLRQMPRAAGVAVHPSTPAHPPPQASALNPIPTLAPPPHPPPLPPAQASAILKAAEAASSGGSERDALARQAVALLLRVPLAVPLDTMVAQLAALRAYEVGGGRALG